MSNLVERAFSRTEILLEDRLPALCDQHILIAGLGGVGAYVAESLARAGIKHLTILDHDVVSASNLNRQLLALHSTLGQKKTEVMAARLYDINPDIQLTVLDEFLYQSEADNFVSSHALDCDYVIDCIDSIACKAALIAACLKQGIPIASSMGAGNRLDVTQIKITTLNQTHGCALARGLRRALRKMDIKANHPVVFSTEAAAQPLPHQPLGEGIIGRDRAVNGTISYLPALFGMMLAGLVIQKLLAEK